LLNRHGAIEEFPPGTLSEDNLRKALLFKELAILRTDAPLFKNVDSLRWDGPTTAFSSTAEKIGDPKLADRVAKLTPAKPESRTLVKPPAKRRT
jgi:hypothetical protein